MNRLKARLCILLSLFSGFVAFLCILFCLKSSQRSGGVVIGAKNCSEQHILGEIIAQLIESQTDLPVVRTFNLEGTSICFNALKAGAVDIYIEYTGTAVLDILKEPLPEQPLFEYVKEVFNKKYAIIWLDRIGFFNSYCLIAHRDLALEKISDLSKRPRLKIAYDPEFASRTESKLLAQVYEGVHCQHLMDQVLLYFSLENRTIDVMSGFSTDGRLAHPQFVLLEDDRKCLPDYEAAPIVRKQCLERHPQLRPVIALLRGAISTRDMSWLNYQVEVERKCVKEVASLWLEDFCQRKGLCQ